MAKKLSDHEKEKGCWFVAVSHDEECRRMMKENIKEFPFWGWIDHAPDKETEESDNHFHTHFIMRTAGSRSIKQVSATLGCPSNYCQVVRQKRSMMRYFIHLDNPDKIQYKKEDIHSSNIATFMMAFTDNSDNDIRRLYADIDRVRRGQISRDDFIDLHYLEFQRMPFYQKIKTYETLQKVCVRTT